MCVMPSKEPVACYLKKPITRARNESQEQGIKHEEQGDEHNEHSSSLTKHMSHSYSYGSYALLKLLRSTLVIDCWQTPECIHSKFAMVKEGTGNPIGTVHKILSTELCTCCSFQDLHVMFLPSDSIIKIIIKHTK